MRRTFKYKGAGGGNPGPNRRSIKSDHVRIAEKAFGGPLPKGANVHHVNGDGTDNRNENLVICQDMKYHKLLHKRQRVVAMGGNPNEVARCGACRRLRNLSEMATARGRVLYACLACYAARTAKRRRLAGVKETTPHYRPQRHWSRYKKYKVLKCRVAELPCDYCDFKICKGDRYYWNGDVRRSHVECITRVERAIHGVQIPLPNEVEVTPMKKKLSVEVNSRVVSDHPSIRVGSTTVMIAPPINESFWLARVVLSKQQAVVCFPKFGTIGIGFQREKDWNTNLPWKCPAEEIYDHIEHNKADRSISRQSAIAAIELLRDFAAGLGGAP